MRLPTRLRRLIYVWDYLLGNTNSPQKARPRLGLEMLEDREVPSVTAVNDSYSVHQGQTIDVLSPACWPTTPTPTATP